MTNSMQQYPTERAIEGAHMRCFQITLGALASAAASYGFIRLGAFEAAGLAALATAVLIHVARTMPLKERLIGSGAIYKRERRTW